MSGELKDIRRRVAAVIREQLTADGWEVFHYHNVIGEGGKYIKVRTGPTTYDYDSEMFEIDNRTVIITAVVGSTTEGYDEEIEDILDDMIDELRVALYRTFCDGGDGQFLRSVVYPIAPTYLDIVGCSLASDTGAVVSGESGIANKPLVVQFTLNTPIRADIEGV